jgi:hypothetical protein
MTMQTVGHVLIVAAIVGGIAAGCAGTGEWGMTPSATVTTTSPGFTENWFKLEWEVSPDSPPTNRVDGYVYNNYGRSAEGMRILVQAFDSGDNLVNQRLEWVGRSVPALSHSYFSVRRLPPADHYRVSVWSYTIQEGKGFPF